MDENKKKIDPRDKSFASPRQLLAIGVANVLWARGNDHHVYLTTINYHILSGWAFIGDAHSFAIMAAAQASDRLVSFLYEAHDSSFGEGAGLFRGVQSVALEYPIATR